jgi:hypothetical protein
VYSTPVVGALLVVRVRDSSAVTKVEQVRVVAVPVAGAVPVVVTRVRVDGQVRFSRVVEVVEEVEYRPRLDVNSLVTVSAVERVKLPEPVPPGPLLLLKVSAKVDLRTTPVLPPAPGAPVLLRVLTVELVEPVDSPRCSVTALEVCRVVAVAGTPPFVWFRVLPRVLAVTRLKDDHPAGAVHHVVISW